MQYLIIFVRACLLHYRVLPVYLLLYIFDTLFEYWRYYKFKMFLISFHLVHELSEKNFLYVHHMLTDIHNYFAFVIYR